MNEPERKRRRPPVSCILCRRRKIKCNRESPCSNCVKSSVSECTYDPHVPQQTQANRLISGRLPKPASTDRYVASPSSAPDSLSSGLTAVPTVASDPGACDVESLKARIKQLEGQLSQIEPKVAQTATKAAPNIEAHDSSFGGSWYVHHDEGAQAVASGVSHKTRRFGRSHWINVLDLLKDLVFDIEPFIRQESCPFLPDHQKCKSLARTIKLQTKPQWPVVIPSQLPAKNIADDLVDCYLRTIESVHRVLHIPSFRKEYEALWVSETRPDPAFLTLLKLVLAIGSASYDDSFSMRPTAVRWVYEALTALAEPNTKHRLHLQGLQIQILCLVAQETVDVSGESTYMSAGELFRKAIFMGLHRDPARLPQKSTLVSEMRRRLWSTILEICLQSSRASGGPPLMSTADFDIEPAGNFDDDQLTADDPAPKPDGEFTQVSISLAIRKTFPIRLAIVKFLNDLHSPGSYDEALRLDAEFRKSYKSISRTLQNLKTSTGPDSSQFALHFFDLLMQRYLLTLHGPFHALSLNQISYAFSRKVVIETSLKIWYIVNPLGSTMPGTVTHSRSNSPVELARICAAGPGFLRQAVNEAALRIGIEVKSQLQEDEGLGSVPLRPDLLAIMRDATEWQLKCIKVGETSVKGYLLFRLVSAYIGGLLNGVEADEIVPLLLQAATEAHEVTLPILEAMASQTPGEGFLDAAGHTSSSTPSDMDWDLMMTDAVFNVDGSDTFGSILHDGTIQTGSFW